MRVDVERTRAGIREYAIARRLVTGFFTAIVVWGAWNAQTDCFPLNENQAYPSRYVYGWPVCFATSDFERFNFQFDAFTGAVGFDGTIFVLDLFVTVVVILATVFMSRSLARRLPRATLSDILAITAGFALMFAVWSGAHYKLLEWTLGAEPPHRLITHTYDTQIASNLPLIVTVPLSIGLVGVGFAIVKLPFRFRFHVRAE